MHPLVGVRATPLEEAVRPHSRRRENPNIGFIRGSVEQPPHFLGPPVGSANFPADPFVKFKGFDSATAAAIKASLGSVAPEGGQLVYRDPRGVVEQTGDGPFRASVIKLFRAMRAGLIPFPTEHVREGVYRAHGQPVPGLGYGLEADSGWTL